MAKIIYALSGQGRGHTSRVMAISDELRKRGHDIVYCCGGTAYDILKTEEERIIPVPALTQTLEGNEVRLMKTARCNWHTVRQMAPTVSELAERFHEERADAVINDFEAFSWRAARQVGLPVISFNHQQVLTETRYHLPVRFWFDAFVACSAIRWVAPQDPEHTIVTSFFFPPVRRPEKTTLVAPIMRRAVQELVPQRGDHVLVYYNEPEGAEYVLDVLKTVDARFVVYNFPLPERPAEYPNLHFKQPSLDGFLKDLATSRAVLCTAGFTLTSEALYLGKPVMVVPNRGIFEQALNALFLRREGLGQAVIGRRIRVGDVTSFLAESDTYAASIVGRRNFGNAEAVACIENILLRMRSIHPVKRSIPYDSGSELAVPVSVAKT